MQRKITLKTAKKQPKGVSIAKIRRVVAKVYATPSEEIEASTPKKFKNIIFTFQNNKAASTK